MDTTGVTETGAPGAGNPSRGDRDGASEGSGSQDPGGISPRQKRHAGTATPERGVPSDGGGDGRVFPSLPPHGAGGTGGRVFPSLPPKAPPREGGDRAPTGAQDAAAISAALRDSLDALISPLHDRLSLTETALGSTRRSRRRRRRMSSSSSDGEYSGGDGGRHVPRRSVTRALGHCGGNPFCSDDAIPPV